MNFVGGLLVQAAVGSLPIQSEKALTLFLYIIYAAQVGLFPDMLVVILMKTFHISIALRMVHRRKN